MTSHFVQVSKPHEPFEIVEPGPTQVCIKVQACGMCHSDSLVKEGLFPGIQYPRVPGHEVAGIIDKVGSDVARRTLALIPDVLSATEAAPLMRAGITTYNALRNSGAHVGDVVAI